MALNYSHRPVFPAHVSEDNLVSPMRMVNGCLVDGVPQMYGENHLWAWDSFRRETGERSFNSGWDMVNSCRSTESSPKDIVDLLPSDPFGMDIETTFTAITGWLEDLEVDYRGYVGNNNGGISQQDYGLFTGWNQIWSNAMLYQSFPTHTRFDEKLKNDEKGFSSSLGTSEKPYVGAHCSASNSQLNEKSNLVDRANQPGVGSLMHCDIVSQQTHNVCDVGFDNGSTAELRLEEQVGCSISMDFSNKEGLPHEALSFALGYLGVKDLLSVEMVCKSLCFAVRSDPLLWRNLHIDQSPLNDKITDDILLKLARRAQGNLRCLSLVECLWISDDGLRCVLETNLQLTKLCVSGCTKLSIEGVVSNLKAYGSGIKHLRIGGIYGVTSEQFGDLKSLLGVGSEKLQNNCRPHFYRRENIYIPCDDDRLIDIEMCPRCEKLKLVYDCPAESCRAKTDASQICRACIHCIKRCFQCGRCVDDIVYEETFCMELFCSDCLEQQFSMVDKKVDNGTQHEPLHNLYSHR